MDRIISCYSPRYSYYEKGLDWLEERIRERFLLPYREVSVSLADLSLEFILKDTGGSIRPEELDWLNSSGNRPVPKSPILITIYTNSGFRKMVMGERVSPARSLAPRPLSISPSGTDVWGRNSCDNGGESDPWTVTVYALVDPGVENPLGEAVFRREFKGRLKDGSTQLLTSRLEEKVVLLLEKEEDGDWKIVSQW
jgi:hypothetical protein